MAWHSVLLLALVGSATAAKLTRRDTVIASSQRVSTYAASFGTVGQLTTVNAGVYYWLSGGGTHNFYGNVNANGQIIVSQTDYLVTNPGAGGQTADWDGHTVTNGNLNISSTGSISLNDFGSASAPTYDWTIRSFTIYGSMQWCGRGDTGGSTYQLYCDLDCYNYGTLEYGQYFNNIGAAFFWRNAALQAPGATTGYYNIYNNGAFRMTNVVFHSQQNIKGTGCMVINTGGVLYLEDGAGTYQSYYNGAYIPTYPNQTIYFTDATGVLHMDTAVYSRNPNFGPQIYGFKPGNAIEFYQSITTTGGYSYSATTGILVVNFIGGNTVNIKLGLGYDPASFYQAANPQKYNTAGYNAIFYRQAAPVQNVPTTCQPALQTCTNPASTAGVTPTYTTQTSAYTGTATITSTATAAAGTTPGTVVVYVPYSYVTTTSGYTGANQLASPSTTTVSPTGTAPGTVIIYTQAPFVTTTVPYTGATPITAPFTSTIAPSGTAPGTIEVFTPASYITSTALYTGTAQLTGPLTSTIAPSGTTPGVVVIYTPPVYSTSTAVYTGTAQLTGPSTSTIPPSGTAPGVVVIYTPASYVTTTALYTGPNTLAGPSTSTVPPSGTAPGTVVVYTPASYVTTTAPYTGPNALTGPSTSTIPPSGTAPGTVVVYTPVSNTGYVTITAPYTGTGFINGPITSTIASPSGTNPGTVEVFTPTATRPATVTTNFGPNQCTCTAV